MLSFCLSSCSDARLHFRNATKSDVPDIALLYTEAVFGSGSDEYGIGQRKAWALRAVDDKKWKERILQQYFVLVEYDGILAGFASLQDGGYIDVMYVHPKFQRLGLASRLYYLLEGRAKKSSADTLWADVSKIAQPFFEKHGFRVQRENENLIGEFVLVNYTMRKQL